MVWASIWYLPVECTGYNTCANLRKHVSVRARVCVCARRHTRRHTCLLTLRYQILTLRYQQAMTSSFIYKRHGLVIMVGEKQLIQKGI